MALENLVGSDKFVANLVATNPTGGDDKREGDDHIRGIKNILRNTFPNLDGAVTSTDESINRAAAGDFTQLLLSARDVSITGRRNGFKFAEQVTGPVGPFNVDITGFSGEGSGVEAALSQFYFVTFSSYAASHVLQGVALYTNNYNGDALPLATLGKRELGGTILFTNNAAKPRISVGNTSGNAPRYYAQIVFLN